LRALYAFDFDTTGDKTRNILSNKDVPIDTSTSGTGTGSRGKGITLDLGNGTPTSSAGRERREGDVPYRKINQPLIRESK